MNFHKLLILASLVFAPSIYGSTTEPIECRGPFHVESISAHSLMTKDESLRGKIEFGLYKTAPTFSQSVICYTVLDPSDPAAVLLKEAYFSNLEFEVCFDRKNALEIDKATTCKSCTSRGDIQGKVRIHRVSFVSESGNIKAKNK